MIHLFLTRDLALHVASHLPPDDPLRLGIAETIGEQDVMGGVIDDPAALTIMRGGEVRMEIYSEAEAERIYAVLTAPRALQAVILEARGRVREDAAVEGVCATLGIKG